jgi:hypothetical protein
MATTTKHNVLTFNEFNESMSTDKCIGAMWNSFIITLILRPRDQIYKYKLPIKSKGR